MSDLEPSLSERAVARLAATLDRSRPSRRSFFARVAIVGSAIAVKPWGYLVEDASAYDVVCGAGNECADGWTAFCCTVTGSNTCPPGSYAAGWWKADASGFCCGSARYYIDCNATCGTSDPQFDCHCASGTCDRRRVACNQFRYGQCHTEIACYGPVVCRVITCQPPWQWDPACTTSSATDNRTASHNAPCLDSACWEPVEDLWRTLGGETGVLGALAGSQAEITPTGFRTPFQYGAIYQWGGRTIEVHGAIWQLYRSMGEQNSSLRYPMANTRKSSRPGVSFSDFQLGAIYWIPNVGAFEVHGAIFDKWASMGRERSSLQLPTTNTRSASRGGARYSDFESGAIYWFPNVGAFEVHGAIFDKWASMGRERSALGFPRSDTQNTSRLGGRRGHFTASGVSQVIDPTYRPIQGRYSDFESGAIYWFPNVGAFEVHGAIFTKWASMGRERSALGFPRSDVRVDAQGKQYVRFDGGRITFDPRTNVVSVVAPS